VTRRLASESPEITSEMDWPNVWEASEVAWKRALEHLTESRARLRQAAEKLRDDELDKKLSAKSDFFYVTLHGLIQHDLYHAGQIAILKKTLGRSNAARAYGTQPIKLQNNCAFLGRLHAFFPG
jgi:hypothetical protein